MRVLVVDDSCLVRKRLVEMLRDSCVLEVHEACDTDQAERLLEDTRIDILVLDMHIGPNSGLDFMSVVKGRMPHVAVLILTNDAGDAHRRECLLRGADYFFDKSRQFELAVEIAIAHAVGRPAGPAPPDAGTPS
ncbi:MAG TPA: response regulator [Polyangiaceae bacterium]|nr:response regulator [Polyangiaceae bacterium]